MVLKFKDMVAENIEGDCSQRTGKGRVAMLKGAGHDPQGGRLIDSEYNDQVIGTVQFCQIFNLFLYRKTYGAGSSSDKTGGCFIDNLTPSCPDAVGDRCSGYVIPFSEDDGFFPL